jgi:lipoprotein NlpI
MIVKALAVVILALTSVSAQRQESARDVFDRAITDFSNSRITEAVAGFDAVAKMAPQEAPFLWQRGIALYYAKRYKDCRAQFESHRTVNSDDVENAAWHFLCVAREESPAKAKAALLPVGPDPRVPMRQVYEMFRGDLKPEDVLKAGAGSNRSEFYAHLYVGLYYEATGNAARAREELTAAAADRYYSPELYMHMVAKVHLSLASK